MRETKRFVTQRIESERAWIVETRFTDHGETWTDWLALKVPDEMWDGSVSVGMECEGRASPEGPWVFRGRI